MRARLGIDKTKAWADWAEDEEEADAMTLETATEPRCMVNTVRRVQRHDDNERDEDERHDARDNEHDE